MAWLEAIYEPTTLFSLRPSWATSTGGKSLLLPSPYAVKMAILDAAIRTSGLIQAEKMWPWIRDLQMGIQLPMQIVVTNLFVRMLRMKEIKTKASEKEAAIAKAKANQEWPFQRTIGYREYVYHPEPIHLVLSVSEKHMAQLSDWLLQVNYIGKRGGFVQLLGNPQPMTDVSNYIMLTAETTSFPLYGLMQQLDDCDPKMKFVEADVYNSKKPKRITRHVVLPYRLKRSSRSYSLYEYSGA